MQLIYASMGACLCLMIMRDTLRDMYVVHIVRTVSYLVHVLRE